MRRKRPGARRQCCDDFPDAAGVDQRFQKRGIAFENTAINRSDCRSDLTVAGEQRIAKLKNAQIRPGSRSYIGDHVEHGTRRPVGPSLGQDQRSCCRRARHASMAMDQEMTLRRIDELPAKADLLIGILCWLMTFGLITAVIADAVH
jgi:hypothetical protein